jgi:hypothetical protein
MGTVRLYLMNELTILSVKWQGIPGVLTVPPRSGILGLEEELISP